MIFYFILNALDGGDGDGDGFGVFFASLLASHTTQTAQAQARRTRFEGKYTLSIMLMHACTLLPPPPLSARSYTHTHTHTTDTHAHRDARTHSHGGDATIVPLKKVGTKPRLINCQQCECDGYTTHNSAPANCVLRARHCRCVRVQAGTQCLCQCVAANCCGRAQARSLVVQNGAQGPVSEQRMMTDLLVRLFCHTHTCHNLPRLDCAALLWRCRCRWLSAPFFCCFCLVFVFRLFLRNVVVVVVVFARFVRLKFIWLWPKGDGL